MIRDRILILSSLLVSMLLVPIAASAQDCLIGAYRDPDGNYGNFLGGHSLDYPSPYVELDVYYVMRVEDFVRGVAWNRYWVNLEGCYACGAEIVGSEPHYDPLEQFLEVTENGFRMGLGDCRVGYGGAPILVLHETLILQQTYGSKAYRGSLDLGYLAVGPNVLEDPDYAVYADCSDQAVKHPCSFTDPVWIVPAKDSLSWGAIKASYR